jgi:hypothetical protein
LSLEQRDRAVAAMQAALTPEMRSEISAKGHAAFMASTTPEQRSEKARRMWARRTDEQKATIGAKIRVAKAKKAPEERRAKALAAWVTRRARASDKS